MENEMTEKATVKGKLTQEQMIRRNMVAPVDEVRQVRVVSFFKPEKSFKPVYVEKKVDVSEAFLNSANRFRK